MVKWLGWVPNNLDTNSTDYMLRDLGQDSSSLSVCVFACKHGGLMQQLNELIWEKVVRTVPSTL